MFCGKLFNLIVPLFYFGHCSFTELLVGIIWFFFGEKRDIEREVDDGESMLFVMAAVKKKNKT